MKRAFVGILLASVLACGCSSIAPEKHLLKPPQTDYAIDAPEFARSLGHLLSAPMVGQNQIEILLNGSQAFPAMLEAVRSAQKSITLEASLFESGEVVTEFVNALSERARAGVKVHVTIDALTSIKFSRKDATTLRDAGVELAYYNAPHFLRLPKFVEHRTHRKLLIVDGRIGFCGGVCFADAWMGNAEPGHWRDTHFRVEGPVVAQMQTVFTENWLQAHSTILHGDDYFPALRASGSMTADFFRSGPQDSAENARISYLLAIGAARHSIRLAHAYFVPSDLSVEALVAARKRGVKVEIILPAKSDHYSIHRASRARWGKLLDAGVEFYEYQPTLYHCKIMVVDDLWVTAGSVNFDERSFRLNDEANLNVINAEFAKRVIQVLDEDKKNSRHMNANEFKHRNWFARIYDHFWGLFRFEM